MNWLEKKAASDKVRIQSNIERLTALRKQVAELSKVALACQSAAFVSLKQLLEEKIVQGRPKIAEVLSTAVLYENNQKVVLDAPTRFQSILNNAIEAIDREIKDEKKALRELDKPGK